MDENINPPFPHSFLPRCLVFFSQMSKDLPTSLRPCPLRSWSGCSTSSLPDLTGWPMWVAFNSIQVLAEVRACMWNEAGKDSAFIANAITILHSVPLHGPLALAYPRGQCYLFISLGGGFLRLIFPLKDSWLSDNQTRLFCRLSALPARGQVPSSCRLRAGMQSWLPAVSWPAQTICSELACSPEPVISWAHPTTVLI